MSDTRKTGGTGPVGANAAGTEKSESMWSVYVRRFRKHTLGKIGFVTLLVLYLMALLADFLSPYSMTWTDKDKAYHPPTPIHFLWNGPHGTVVRPFVYEQVLTNVALKQYGIIPPYALRFISIEQRPNANERRDVTYARDPAERKSAILRAVEQQYGLSAGDPEIDKVSAAIDRITSNSIPDERVRFDLGNQSGGGSAGHRAFWVVEGNKNFVTFFDRGITYSFLGLFQTNIHLFGSPTGGYFILGTDHSGRDIVSRLLQGSRISLSVGLVGAAITFLFGLIIGGIAGYAGGAIDNILMRLSEVVISFPAIYLLFALRASFPPSLNSVQIYLLIVVILSGVGWAGLARIIRGLVLSIKNEDFVMAARTMGLSHWKIIRKHILPNTLSFTIVQLSLTIPGFILGESALSLLGLGITEPQSSWGLMLAAARNYRVVHDFPWILVPGVFIFLAILAWNFFGDGIRDAVDPRSKH